MAKKETVTQEDLFEVLDMIESVTGWMAAGVWMRLLEGRRENTGMWTSISMPRAPKNYGRSWKKKGMR